MRFRSIFLPLFCLVLVAIGVQALISTPAVRVRQPAASPRVLAAEDVSGTLYVPPSRLKTAGCVGHDGLPDFGCSPGAVFLSVSVSEICTSGYSAKVRSVPEAVKNQVYAEYGVKTHYAGEYEVDHIISLELGGSNDIANLWPEPAEPVPGFHQKDIVENYLHQLVCSGKMSLPEAQKIIATDWLHFFQNMRD